MQNIHYSLIEDKINRKISYEELKEEVNEREKEIDLKQTDDVTDFYSQICFEEQDYMENYTKKQLDLIADYYKISKRKKRKHILIEDIVAFENNMENEEIVSQRKLMWFYVEQIKCDNYLSKFLILE
tara:strand:+ start:138 stop:518 length:381 start_codon:yes stop_codon:yes gene_type:complete